MQRKPLFLAAAVAEIVRFFLLGLAAEATGLLGASSLAADFYRYALAPQLLFGAAFFFLWLDGARYAVYRPLALAGKTLSLLSFIALSRSLLGSFGAEGLLPLPGTAFAASLGILILDLAGLALLLFYAKEPSRAELPQAAADPLTGPSPQAASGPQANRVQQTGSGSRAGAGQQAGAGQRAGSGPAAASGPRAGSGPRGPEDIEQVEV